MLAPSALTRCWRRSLVAHIPPTTIPKRFFSSNEQVFLPGDIVLLRHMTQPTRTYLSSPLYETDDPVREQTACVKTHIGVVAHKDILYKRVRDVVATKNGRPGFRLTFPTLEEHILKTRRLVTPVYPLDAATIVSLLDLHVEPLTSPDQKPVEVLEAGTGHGSLTLALCRAVHAANPLPPPSTSTSTTPSTSPPAQRGAIIHSLDKSRRHSEFAQRKVVGRFRRGMYLRDVDFHVTEPTPWLHQQLAERNHEPFLTATILDLPSVEDSLEAAADATLLHGVIGVWCPNVTQIVRCVEHIRERIPTLVVDTVVEFPGGGGVGAGLRRWDVRVAKIRASARGEEAGESEGEEQEQEQEQEEGEQHEEVGEGLEEGRGEKNATHRQAKDTPGTYATVCRPRPGERIVGGGFFALFRKREYGPSVFSRRSKKADAGVGKEGEVEVDEEMSAADEAGGDAASEDAASEGITSEGITSEDVTSEDVTSEGATGEEASNEDAAAKGRPRRRQVAKKASTRRKPEGRSKRLRERPTGTTTTTAGRSDMTRSFKLLKKAMNGS